MTALANEPVHATAPTATCVLVDVRDCGLPGVRWAADCADALGVGLVVHAGVENDPAHVEVAALLAGHPGLTVHVEHHDRPLARWEGALVVISRDSALAAPPLAGDDCRDVVVVSGTLPRSPAASAS
ncbi:hypothetical protein BBK82_29770 [Lentzea guizhouensis]|uniref:Uncharacterized protein n=1 Tax=Lentzea guizhouensis TaxID=1586287 RepID=A0A1B2HPE2_9PSEU|nr:hypothetical protein [Lentzea guizhouensis]ANZ39612.1 hypothetical protein BBK82_29770 [Lentzea guizhouensis]